MNSGHCRLQLAQVGERLLFSQGRRDAVEVKIVAPTVCHIVHLAFLFELLTIDSADLISVSERADTYVLSFLDEERFITLRETLPMPVYPSYDFIDVLALEGEPSLPGQRAA